MSTQRADCIDPHLCNRDGARTNDAAAAACSLLSLSVSSGRPLPATACPLAMAMAYSLFVSFSCCCCKLQASEWVQALPRTTGRQQGFAGRRWRDKCRFGRGLVLILYYVVPPPEEGASERWRGWTRTLEQGTCRLAVCFRCARAPSLPFASAFLSRCRPCLDRPPNKVEGKGTGRKGGHASGKKTTPPRVAD